jgi:hypothetical protein
MARKKRKRVNPAVTASQYGAAQAVLGDLSSIMPRKVAREIVDKTPPALRSKFAKELARRRHGNPTQSDLDAAARMFTKFHGKEPGHVTTVDQLRVTPAVLADCGRLVELVFKRPGFVREVYPFAESNGRQVRVATTGDGGQLYFVGGDQEIDLRGGGFTLPKDHVWLGTCVSIAYHTSKDFHNFKPSDYGHKFGDEGGLKPEGGYDVHSKRLYLIGGDYRVKREGIVG